MWFLCPTHADLYLSLGSARLISATINAEVPSELEPSAAIADLLSRHPKVNQVTIWLGDALVQYGVLRATQGRLSHQDLLQLVASELTLPAASVGQGYQIDLCRPDPLGQRLWAATSQECLAKIAASLKALRVKVRAIAPVLTALRWSQTLAARTAATPASHLLIREPDRLTLLKIDAGQIIAVRQLPVAADLAAVRQALERLQIQTGLPSTEIQWLDLTGAKQLSSQAIGLAAESMLALPKHWQGVHP